MLLAPFANKLSRHNFVRFLKFLFPSFCVAEDSHWQRVDCIGNFSSFYVQNSTRRGPGKHVLADSV